MTAVISPSMTVLHLGCGRKKTPASVNLCLRNADGSEMPAEDVRFLNLDMNASVEPDLRCELGVDRIPLDDNVVDFTLAMHVIEHIGEIGKLRAWFYFWEELYRVMKPGGQVQFECPYHSSIWAWADPTHIRAISEYTFLYLNQDAYKVGGAIPDYRPPFDFVLAGWELVADTMNPEIGEKEAVSFIRGRLTARKPLKPYWEAA